MSEELPSWVKDLREINFKKPKRYYPKTIRATALYLGRDRIKILNDIKQEQYTCYYCKGEKKLYNPNDCDPIEGYKMADRNVICPICDAKGTVPKELFKNWHDVQEQGYAKRLKNYNKAVKLVKNILKDLTNVELYYLNTHFRPDFYGTFDY